MKPQLLWEWRDLAEKLEAENAKLRAVRTELQRAMDPGDLNGQAETIARLEAALLRCQQNLAQDSAEIERLKRVATTEGDKMIAEIERLRAEALGRREDAETSKALDIVERNFNSPVFHSGTPERELVYAWKDELENLRAENARLRAALQRIVDEADSDDGLTAWDGSDIARAALTATA